MIDLGSGRDMGDVEKPKPEPVKSPQDLWNTFRQMMERDGFDLSAAWWKLIVEQMQWVSSSAARRDFEELCEAGCFPLILASIIGLIRLAPRLKPFWKVMLLHPKERKKMAAVLEKAAAMLGDSFRDVIAAEGENQKADYAAIGRVPPSRLVSEIRFWATMIKIDLKLADELQVYSLAEFTRYLLVGYVRRATGTFCDRNVSGLTGAIVDSPDHNEVAQRMWRYRNYNRLETHLSWIPDFLLEMSNDMRNEMVHLT